LHYLASLTYYIVHFFSLTDSK